MGAFEALIRDVTHGTRLLTRHRGFAAAALITIALGVGGTSAVFSVVYGVLLRPLPYPEPDRLVRLSEVHPGANAPFTGALLSTPTYHAWVRASRADGAETSATVTTRGTSGTSLEDIGAFRVADYTVNGVTGAANAAGATGATGTMSAGGPGGADAGLAQRVRGTLVTPSVLRLLHVSPFAGRFFSDADAEPGAEAVVVISYGMWRERFGGGVSAIGTTSGNDATSANHERGTRHGGSALGASITLDGVPYRVVGIAPPGFAFPSQTQGWSDSPRDIALYTPLVVHAINPNATVIGVVNAIARLAPGATIAQAEAEGTAYARHADRPFAELVFGKGGPVDVRVRSIADQMTMTVQPALMVLTAAIGLVLLIACANVANLLLSRGADRTREIAVRAALGAGRRRLVAQLLTESLVISLIGGAAGVFVGWVLTTSVPALAPAGFPRVDDVRVDAWFLTVAMLTAIVIGSVSGLLPAWRIARVDLASTMTASGPRTIGIGAPGARLRRLLLIAEAALAVVLLVGAALLTRSFIALLHVDAGYDATHVLTADIHVTRTPAPAAAQASSAASAPQAAAGAAAPSSSAAAAVRAASAATAADRASAQLAMTTLERVRAIPGVHAAGAGTMAPFGGVLNSSGFALPGVTTVDGRPVVARALQSVITPGYAEALGLRLKEGRFFRVEDTTSPTIAMLVNETFAKTYLADGRPVTGRRFSGMFPRILGRTDALVEIIGVVGDILPGPLDARAQPLIYLPPGVGFEGGFSTLVVKTGADAAAIAPIVKSVVQQTHPGAAIDRVGLLTDKVSASVSEPRFAACVLAAFALLALTLATTGLYGVLSHTVAQRRREIGVRAALGATRRDLVMMILREGLTVTAVGLVVGLLIAALAARAIAALLFGVTSTDVVAFAVAPLLLLVVASAACLIPARRAATIDPADALRTD